MSDSTIDEPEDGMRTTEDPYALATDSAELHAKLIEARDALKNNHEAKAALLIEEATEECSDLTGRIKNL